MSNEVYLSLQLPLGFLWSSAVAGLKASGKPDVAIAHCPGGANAAAMFTSNQMVAAPITVGRAHLAATGSRVTGVLVNAGNANCATGAPGIEACKRACIALGDQLGCVFDEVFPSSTGIIGVPLPVEKLLAALPKATDSLAATPAAAEAFSTAILTTDTRQKTATITFDVEDPDAPNGKRTVHLWGCAKGAGMIGPQLIPHATMLVYLFTDLDATPSQLAELLTGAVADSFNAISIDGDMSTNDTVLLLASGKSGVPAEGFTLTAFRLALAEVCRSLAFQIVDDGEGVTHVVTLEVTGARSVAEARQIARTIGESPLCKTAWSSADPNWGRILAAAGRAGVPFDPARITITIGGLPVFAAGVRSPQFDEAATHAAMSAREYTIALDLGMRADGSGEGDARASFLTGDLTHEYVSINADYSS